LGSRRSLSTQVWNHYQAQVIVDVEEATKLAKIEADHDAALLQAQFDRRFAAVEKEIERLDSEVEAIRKPQK
jgi:hypothetical protein